jgi:hypothetical protein
MHYTIEHLCSKCGKHGHGSYQCKSNYYICCDSKECKFLNPELEQVFEFHSFNRNDNTYDTIYYYTNGKHIYKKYKNNTKRIHEKEFLNLYSRDNYSLNCIGDFSEDVIAYLKRRLKQLHLNQWDESSIKVFKLFYFFY